MAQPIAVIAGDIHYNLNTLELADAVMRMAINKSNQLNVPFIANGDTHDSKANLRGECVNAMIETFKRCKLKPYVNIGNHCKINERSESHALNFLAPYAYIINEPTYISSLKAYIIPYQHNIEFLKNYLSTLPKKSLLIMHQGVSDSYPGEYIQDKTAISKNYLSGFRTILSHYHRRQDIICKEGLASYIGNAYTLGFGEANDPPKGFQILMDDNSLKFIPTNLRKHIIATIVTNSDMTMWSSEGKSIEKDDLVWVKVRGPKEVLLSWNRQRVADLIEVDNFKLDLIPNDIKVTDTRLNLTQGPLLDSLIDSLSNTSDERKIRLKDLWKTLV